MSKDDKKRELEKPTFHELAKETNTKHGLYRLQELALADWPPALKEKYEERYTEVVSYLHVDPELHKGAVAQLVRTEMLVSICCNWLIENGPILPNGKVQPVLGVFIGMENSLSRQYAGLGLCPLVSRKVRALTPVGDYADILSGDGDNGD